MSNTTMLTEEQQKQKDDELSSSIMLAIEIDSAFKLYSYRIIDQATYCDRVNDLLEVHKITQND